jgi:hypothetical protein
MTGAATGPNAMPLQRFYGDGLYSPSRQEQLALPMRMELQGYCGS